MTLLPFQDAFPALMLPGSATITHAELSERTRALASGLKLSRGKGLLFLFARNTVSSILAYLAAIEAGHAIALLDDGLKTEFAAHLVDHYQPDLIYLEGSADWLSGYSLTEDGFWKAEAGVADELHPDLLLLLTTSGSTGSPKFVRLSRENVVSNARAISESLRLTRDERAVTTLPFHYSYGLSVLNSHLISGASVVVTEASVMEQAFWDILKSERVTSIAGVPYTYQMLDRLGFANAELPDLRNLTQAGGKLSEPLTRKFMDLAGEKRLNFFVMYGQTEASPRISCVPPERLAEKFGSAGMALPGGELLIETAQGCTTAPEVTGEIVYRGPNVMMGYAESRTDLALGDVQGEELYTGDLGYLDTEGFLFITGRSKRIAKVFGVRLNLDEVEALFRNLGTVAVLGAADKLHVFHESTDDALLVSTRKQVALDLKIPVQTIVLKSVGQLPTMSSGKIDYRILQSVLDGGSA
ncbi:AMP-binding protein [Deinococcus sp. NW-56]|uniref:AMP-binding protein n=1 Tax=Deinococcus sp. NW-56 TaxID=2080419 RepID=UPI000CF4A04F|nr:AMP-binding protein [Deinococcus sp. NW-56]